MSDKGAILVVDDDPKSLTLLVAVLGKEGYRVQPADSGKLALASVSVHPPNLILLDLRMPGMDGFEVCRRIKATEAGRRIPIIFISASTNVDEWVEALELGAVDFVSKPFRREELVARVRTHMELGRLRADLEAQVADRTAMLRDLIEQLRLENRERRRAEQEARESEARFRQIANAAPVMMWTCSPDGRVKFVNDYALTFTGQTFAKLIGDGWTELVHSDDAAGLQRNFREARAGRNDFQAEYRLRRADGEYCCVLSKAAPRFLADGEFAGYAGIVVDITEVKRSQERAMRTQYLEHLRVLSAGIAHDFNTLIGAIFGEVDLELADMPADSPGRETLQRIDSVAKRAGDIVHLLMAYIGDGSDHVQQESIDVNAVVREIVPHLKASMIHNAVIRTTLVPELPSIDGNLHQIRQVILNLVMNAVEALEGEKGFVTVTTATDGQWVRIEVSDTGRKVTSDEQRLGLVAVRGIVQSHGGTVDSRGVPGEGSTFEVMLPAAGLAALAGAGGLGPESRE